MFSLRSQVNLETFFCKFYIGLLPNITEPSPTQGRIRPNADLVQRQISHYYCILGNTPSFIVELIAPLISVCISFINQSISWDNLAFNSLENISTDSSVLRNWAITATRPKHSTIVVTTMLEQLTMRITCIQQLYMLFHVLV